MKIIISSQNNEIESLMDPRFGRCQYFCIYDTETKENNFVVNNAINMAGGAGIQAANQIIKENAKVVITGNLGPNATEVLENANIKFYLVEIKKISEIINDYNNNKLV